MDILEQIRSEVILLVITVIGLLVGIITGTKETLIEWINKKLRSDSKRDTIEIGTLEKEEKSKQAEGTFLTKYAIGSIKQSKDDLKEREEESKRQRALIQKLVIKNAAYEASSKNWLMSLRGVYKDVSLIRNISKRTIIQVRDMQNIMQKQQLKSGKSKKEE